MPTTDAAGYVYLKPVNFWIYKTSSSSSSFLILEKSIVEGEQSSIYLKDRTQNVFIWLFYMQKRQLQAYVCHNHKSVASICLYVHTIEEL
jgi:hypothetical protein